MLDAYDWDFCQIQYNYAGEHYQAGTAGLMAAAERGLAVFVMEPLLGGRLAGNLPPRARAVLDGACDRHLHMPPPLGGSRGCGIIPGDHVAFGYDRYRAGGREFVTGRPRVAEFDDANQLDTIARVLMEFEKSNRVPCTGCGYCMPCPKGINITGCFAAYNASYAHSWFTGLSQYFTASAVRTSEPKLVSNCVKCGKCARRTARSTSIFPSVSTMCADVSSLVP